MPYSRVQNRRRAGTIWQKECMEGRVGFLKNFLYQGGVKSTVSWVFEDLKFQKATTKIGVFLTLPSELSQLN